ncbi:MAG: HlyD family efflux transporter periplasmic adaptor subunit [Pseudomonadota bacterium]
MIQDTSGQDVAIESADKPKRIVFISVIALALVAFAAHAFMNQTDASKSIKRSSVQIATLETGDLVRDLIANGRIVAASAPQLYAPEQGFVELLVNPGDEVSIGQIVAVVDSPELENRLKQEQSEFDRLQGEYGRQQLDARRQRLQLDKQLDLSSVDLQAAEREFRRAEASIKDNLISQIDHEKAIDDLARAQLNFKHAKQEVELAKDTLNFELEAMLSTVQRQQLVVDELSRQNELLNIKATVDGVVGNLLVQQRALVNQNAPLMALVDLSAYEAEVQVPESNANELSIGIPVEIKIGANELTGILTAISPEVSNRQVTTRVRFDNQSMPELRQNQQVTARMLLEHKEDVLKVRRGSFTQSGGFVAYKIDGDVARKVDIQLGASSMREIEVLSGLDINDQIIISNYQDFIEADSVLLRQ